MHKLCTLKDLSPGTMVEVPKIYASHEAETAVVLGLAYDSSNKRIVTDLVKRDVNTGEFIGFTVPAQSEDTTLVVRDDDKVLEKTAIAAFVQRKIQLPHLGMSLGCDPEIFVEHEDGTVFPAWEFMPDEDEARKSIKAWDRKCVEYKQATPVLVETSLPNAGRDWALPSAGLCPLAVPAYWDGAQAEFAPWAKDCLETLHYGTRAGLKSVLGFARAKDIKAKLSLNNVVELPKTVLEKTDQKFIQFRCSQSFNVYNDPGMGAPNAREYKWRCAGGHIHIGYNRAFTATGIEQIVRGLDGVLGVAGVSLAAGIDNPERRNTYGRAGEFRLPKHGIEYRVLSNHWLSHPAISMLVFELARVTVRFAESGLFNLCWRADADEIREVINNCDIDGARKILSRNAAVLVGLLKRVWTDQMDYTAEPMRVAAFKTIMHGIGAVVKSPYDIESNWKLNDDAAWKYHCRGEGDNWKSFVKGLE